MTHESAPDGGLLGESAPDGASRKERLRPAPRLIAITDRTLATAAETLSRFERLARAARPFSVMFQLRDPQLTARERLEFGRSLRTLCTAEQQWFQVNDRCDLAVLLGADAVHLGERSVSAADARTLVGRETYISRACHDPECEFEDGVDAWVLSPIFAERKGRGALGVEGVRRLSERCARVADASRAGAGSAGALAAGDGNLGGGARAGAAVFGLGGVSATNAPACLSGGAFGVAAVGAILVGQEFEALVGALAIAR